MGAIIRTIGVSFDVGGRRGTGLLANVGIKGAAYTQQGFVDPFSGFRLSGKFRAANAASGFNCGPVHVYVVELEISFRCRHSHFPV